MLQEVDRRVQARLRDDLDWADEVPRLRGRVVASDGRYGVAVDPEWAWAAQVRFRPSPTAGLEAYTTANPDALGVAWARGARLGDEVWFQVGLRMAGDTAVYEPWACVPIEAAGPAPEPDPADAEAPAEPPAEPPAEATPQPTAEPPGAAPTP